jgi:hypothetical protein
MTTPAELVPWFGCRISQPFGTHPRYVVVVDASVHREGHMALRRISLGMYREVRRWRDSLRIGLGSSACRRPRSPTTPGVTERADRPHHGDGNRGRAQRCPHSPSLTGHRRAMSVAITDYAHDQIGKHTGHTKRGVHQTRDASDPKIRGIIHEPTMAIVHAAVGVRQPRPTMKTPLAAERPQIAAMTLHTRVVRTRVADRVCVQMARVP